jgi:hypothetical protein
MASSNQPRRRFAPVPIETTFQSVRKSTQTYNQPRIGPSAELTPDASPRSPSPVPRELQNRPIRRFAPQLIETSRRARRVGDAGPATRPTDKTDITPYTKNIYSAKPKARHVPNEDDTWRRQPPTRRETEDQAVKAYLLELAAKEAERQIQEAALAAFPNSQAREGGVAHFYFLESSDEDVSQPATIRFEEDGNHKARRKSSDLGITWWHQHMRDHASQLARDRGGDDDEAIVDQDMDTIMMSDSELDKMDLSLPPDAVWTTSSRGTPAQRRDSGAAAEAEAAAAAARQAAAKLAEPSPADQDKQPEIAPQGPTQSPFGGFGRPFGAFVAAKPESSEAKKLRKLASPPMLGKDLVFRTCPSPQMTKLEPTHDFDKHQAELTHRDPTGQGGLWNGFCAKTGEPEDDEQPWGLSGPHGPQMLTTPAPGTPEEIEDAHVSDEPESMHYTSDAIAAAAQNGGNNSGLHLLHGVRLQPQSAKAQAQRNEKIALEFDDEFITQVYNYLSLGYPATACAFDDELAKISHMSVYDLREMDAKQMAKGHMLEMNLSETPEEERCPRWRALKIYIIEWARQHPDLNALDPLAWGVRERRGSWAI